MLIFTQSQIEQLDHSSREDFIKKVTLDIIKNEVGISSELSHNELLKRVRATISCAKSFGLSNQYSLAMFTKLSFIAGPRFYKYPIINAILLDENITHRDRIDLLIKKMRDKWDDIEEINDWDLYCKEFIVNY